MENQPVFKEPSTPSKALHQISPERMNLQRLPQSPSHNSFLTENERPNRRDSTASLVQDKVAFLNSLSNNNSPTRHGRTITAAPNNNAAAFQRAILGYEESQATLATASAEIERLKEELKTGNRRERMVSERIESLMEQLQRERERRNSDKEAYVKEIKKCRKQTYQAELAQVEAREELKETRAEIRKLNGEVTHERAEKEKARQEAFERAYAIAGITEESEALRDKIKAVEKERDAAVSELKATEISRQEMLSLATTPVPEQVEPVEAPPTASQAEHQKSQPRVDDHLLPRTRPVGTTSLSGHASLKFGKARMTGDQLKARLAEIKLMAKAADNEPLTPDEQIQVLKLELKQAQKRNADHEDLIHFLHMQCQFKACPCRQAERNGQRFVHDFGYDDKLIQERAAKKRRLEEDEKFKQLPPEPTPAIVAEAIEKSFVPEAVEIPLPESNEAELEQAGLLSGNTSLLEEITQVMIEPVMTNNKFSFSTSTSSHIRPRDLPPHLPTLAPTSFSEDADLFDLSPQKPLIERPSTALGVMTVPSPIKLVADSPRTAATLGRQQQRSQTPALDPTTQSSTTRVALKGSPTHQHRRTQSKPNLKVASKTQTLHHARTGSKDVPKPTAGSPASSTLFPVTPVVKHARSHHNLTSQHQPQTAGPKPTSTSGTTTTTTMIPLRGVEEDDVFSPASEPAQPASYHAGTPSANLSSSSESTTTTLPLRDAATDLIPGTPISREAALAQIRARRDRARSVNLKKDAGSGVKSAPGSAKRGLTLRDGHGAALLGLGREGDRGRDVSQASAPGRFAS